VFLRRLLKRKLAMLSLLVLLLFILAAVLAPYLAPFSPTAVNPRQMLEAPNPTHLLGTDHGCVFVGVQHLDDEEEIGTVIIQFWSLVGIDDVLEQQRVKVIGFADGLDDILNIFCTYTVRRGDFEDLAATWTLQRDHRSVGAGQGQRPGTGAGVPRPRTAQSFTVPRAEIAAQGYDLSLNRNKEVVHEEVEHRAPREILAQLERIEAEIQQGMRELEGMLG
jgi:hypothetical protein